MIWGNTARLFAENCGARLAGIVISPDDQVFETKSQRGPEINKRYHIQKLHASTSRVFFVEVAEAPQAATTQTHSAGAII